MESKNTHTRIELRDPADLRVHPLKKSMPKAASWQKGGEDFNRLLDDIRERGVIDPLKVDATGQILDGESCWLVAKILHLPEVPVAVTGEEPATVILGSLLNRRHLTKGALMWTAFDLFVPEYEAAMRRRRTILRENPNVLSITDSIGDRSFETRLKRLGFSKDLFDQAKQLRVLFAKHTEKRSITSKETKTTVHNVTLREYYEPLILAGEIGLGAAYAGAQSSIRNAVTPQIQRTQATLFELGLGTLRTRFVYWTELSEGEKSKATAAIYETVEAMPEEVRDEFEKAIRAAKKTEGRKAA